MRRSVPPDQPAAAGEAGAAEPGTPPQSANVTDSFGLVEGALGVVGELLQGATPPERSPS